MTKATEPAPGSEAARLAGCTCPVLDNRNGRGFVIAGRIVYVYNYDCPLHNTKDNAEAGK